MEPWENLAMSDTVSQEVSTVEDRKLVERGKSHYISETQFPDVYNTWEIYLPLPNLILVSNKKM